MVLMNSRGARVMKITISKTGSEIVGLIQQWAEQLDSNYRPLNARQFDQRPVVVKERGVRYGTDAMQQNVIL